MLESALIVLGTFVTVILLILTNKMNRAIAAISGSIVCYFTLTFIEKQDFLIFVDFLIGKSNPGHPDGGFVNLHSIILILGMMFIVQICHEAGVFQFIAFRLVQFTKGKPTYLLFILCTLTVLISAVLNNILTVIILIPLTIMVSKILNIDSQPYILMEAILVNLGGTFFSISSVPNILVTNSAGISFGEFFINVGLLSIVTFTITLGFFFVLYRKKLIYNEENTWILQEYNAWNFVQNRSLLYKCLITLLGVIICFVVIPTETLPPDIIALTGAFILVISSKLAPREIIKKIDFEFLLYLLGIFVIAGALETTGVIKYIGDGLAFLGGDDPFAAIMIILWVSAFLSASIDNIPITQVLIPVVGVIAGGLNTAMRPFAYYSLIFGANWGDNLTPMGDNILVVTLAEQNKRPINIKAFTKLGFVTTVFQLVIISTFYAFIMNIVIGIILSSVLVIVIIFLLSRQKKRNKLKEKNTK
ncbi:MAG: transport protein [Promethearchaeota archaeon CR_4]|nr:MAG: transport protein [Candidatus Lokiarchaeota archaeon CR_4]